MLTSRIIKALSSSTVAKWIATRAPGARELSRRFVPGESVDSAIEAARAADRDGLKTTLNYLGEHIENEADARAAADTYIRIVERISDEELPAGISVKPSQMGQTPEGTTYRDQLERIVRAAEREGVFVRFDMESSELVDSTLEAFERLWNEGSRNIGVVLQAYLHRTPEDLDRMIRLGAPIRLCKGAYQEPARIAIQDDGRIREAFTGYALQLLERGRRPAIATHDEAVIRRVRDHVSSNGLDPRAFEFQLLYGVRRDLQSRLLGDGYRVRVYVPFGEMWYSYLMRRLAERPKNLRLIAGSLLRDVLPSGVATSGDPTGP